MEINKIVRSICYFTDDPSEKTVERLRVISDVLTKNHFIVQTKRICTSSKDIAKLQKLIPDEHTYLSIGTIKLNDMRNHLHSFLNAKNVSLNIELSEEKIDFKCPELLFTIIKSHPEKTFLFAFVFNNKNSSPFFPSADYAKDGFSIGLQPTDLSTNCLSVDAWFQNMNTTWQEIDMLFSTDSDFLGIDSSTAPLLGDTGSLIGFMRRLGIDFSAAVLTSFFLKITDFIQNHNPHPVGLCGLMIPCLEDSHLAFEYEKGNFSIERNIFLSLHCGLGIDVYPIGIDENKEKILQTLQLVQGLSNKYKKPLSVRFVSDGKAKIGDKTNFKNEFLQDVTIKPL